MANTYTLIEAKTLGSAVSTVTLGSGGTIPQTYTDLVIKLSIRNDGSATGRNLFYRFNGSTSSMSYTALQGNGSAASSFSSTTDMHAGDTPAATATANTFSNSEVYIPNYTSANYKSSSADGTQENNQIAAITRLVANLWSNIAAVTSITFYSNAGNFDIGSTFYLYGIKNN